MPDKKLNLTGANKILSGESPNLNLDAASAILKKSRFGIWWVRFTAWLSKFPAY